MARKDLERVGRFFDERRLELQKESHGSHAGRSYDGNGGDDGQSRSNTVDLRSGVTGAVLPVEQSSSDWTSSAGICLVPGLHGRRGVGGG